MPEMFDEIARKNCPFRERYTPAWHEKWGCESCRHVARLAQAAVEAMEQHLRDWKCPKPICSSGINSTCQSDILRRTQEIYEKGK